MKLKHKHIEVKGDCKGSKEGDKASKKEGTVDSDQRFMFEVTTDDLNKLKEGHCPANTAKNNAWALKTFEEWRIARNSKFPADPCPENILTLDNKEIVCSWFCKFISEARKADGHEYTPRSLYLILAGLQRHMRQLKPSDEINIFQDVAFKSLRNVCDALFKQLHSKGIGTEAKATPVITVDDEDALWEKGILDLNTPKGLLRAVFFYNGKNLCLRGGQEQRNLRISQFARETVAVDGKRVVCYTYTEFGSKNRQGGFGMLNKQNKVVKQYENANPDRCHVRILDKYLSLLPEGGKANDIFYLTPLPSKPADPGKPWYTNTPVGRNRLNLMMKEMCKEAEFDKSFTNHSLRAYGATKMYQAKVPEKLIQQRTGHRSLEGLRRYERNSVAQLVDISNVLSNDPLPAPVVQQSSQVTSTSSITENPTSIVFRGCTFTGCAISMSGQATNENQYDNGIQELLKGIDVSDIFDD